MKSLLILLRTRHPQWVKTSSNKDLLRQLSPPTEFSGIKEIQTNVFP